MKEEPDAVDDGQNRNENTEVGETNDLYLAKEANLKSSRAAAASSRQTTHERQGKRKRSDNVHTGIWDGLSCKPMGSRCGKGKDICCRTTGTKMDDWAR